MQLALKTFSEPGLFKRLFFWVTKWRLLTEYPHAGVVIGGQIMHSNLSNGLHIEAFDPEGWDLFDVPDQADIVDLFVQYQGTKYDWFSLLAFVLPWRVRDGDRMYCYEWCWLAMTAETPTGRVTPEMLLALANRIKAKTVV